MADFSRDFRVAYDEAHGSCTIWFRCFDTPNSVTVYGIRRAGAHEAEAESALLEARAECLRLHGLWSFSNQESDIAAVNKGSGRIEVSEDTAEIIVRMQEFGECEPAFDFTVGPVSFLWKHAKSVPDEATLQEALAHVGRHKVHVGFNHIEKLDAGVKVDVGGAAKGYAADLVARVLRRHGVVSADIDLGGNLFMLGDHPEGRPWRVSVRIPQGIAADPVILEVSDESVVTSGSYERFVEIGGKRYQHIVDARTGWPSESDIVSATVVAKSSLNADMLATTACLVGSAGIDALRARHPECRIVAITEAGSVLS